MDSTLFGVPPPFVVPQQGDRLHQRARRGSVGRAIVCEAVLLCVHDSMDPRCPHGRERARVAEPVTRQARDSAQGLAVVAVELARLAAHARTPPRTRGVEPVLLELLPCLVVGALSRRRPLATPARREYPESLGQLRGSGPGAGDKGSASSIIDIRYAASPISWTRRGPSLRASVSIHASGAMG